MGNRIMSVCTAGLVTLLLKRDNKYMSEPTVTASSIILFGVSKTNNSRIFFLPAHPNPFAHTPSMEWVLGLGTLYVFGHKFLTNNLLVRKAQADTANRTDTEFDEYTRDDYADERMHFPDNYSDQDLLEMGVLLGDKEYMTGPDPEREHSSFDPLGWYNGPNVTSITQSHGYLI